MKKMCEEMEVCFFFQAEDGIRDYDVTGVQTCALPICIGIAEDEIKNMLEPFTQACSGVAKRHEGSGLGLYLVKMLVEEHGGLFEIESVLGRGTKVTIRFPRDRVIDGPRLLETTKNAAKPRLKKSW